MNIIFFNKASKSELKNSLSRSTCKFLGTRPCFITVFIAKGTFFPDLFFKEIAKVYFENISIITYINV